MYRVTGDTVWYPSIKRELQSTLATLRSDADSLSDSSYSRRRVNALVSGMDWGKRKNDERLLLFRDQCGILLQLNILYNLATVDDYQLEDSCVNSVCLRALSWIQPEAIVGFLTDSATIVSYGPQAANAVEYLRQLGFADVRQEFRATFRRVFPDSRDKKLDDRQFGDKVYGLTHTVIAASGYYQWAVDSAEFRPILEYFKSRQNRIIKNLPADIIAEVGLSLLLCGDSANGMVDMCRKAVVKRFDKATGLILSTNGLSDLSSGEHRNILTYMLLKWPNHVHPGPRFP